MTTEWNSILSNDIYYSPISLLFYKKFSSSVDGIRELPTSIVSYLSSKVDVTKADFKNKIVGVCVGRCQDDNEVDETEFLFQDYIVELVAIDVGNINDLFIRRNVVSRRVSKALKLASNAHSTQRRKSDNSPYINHLIEVQHLLVNTANINDEDIVIAGILHDIIEDSEVNKKDLLIMFGSRVSNLVLSLTDDKSLPLIDRRAKVLAKLVTAPQAMKQLKLADICSNASVIPASWTTERLNEYFQWLDEIASICRTSSESLYQEYLTKRL
jgi:hypothetical protein